MIDKKNKKNGLVMLVLVIIIGAAALLSTVSAVLLGVRDLEIAVVSDRGLQTKSLADGCLDRALLNLRINPDYDGENFSDGDTECIIEINDEGGGEKQARVSAKSDDYYQALKVEVTPSASDRSLIVKNYSFVQ